MNITGNQIFDRIQEEELQHHTQENKDIVTWRLKAGIVESEETSIARKLLGKHFSAKTPNDGTIGDRRCFLWVRPEAI
jgi:hypothetical protein